MLAWRNWRDGERFIAQSPAHSIVPAGASAGRDWVTSRRPLRSPAVHSIFRGIEFEL